MRLPQTFRVNEHRGRTFFLSILSDQFAFSVPHVASRMETLPDLQQEHPLMREALSTGESFCSEVQSGSGSVPRSVELAVQPHSYHGTVWPWGGKANPKTDCQALNRLLSVRVCKETVVCIQICSGTSLNDVRAGADT
jgi:hypothetical protein